MKIDLITLHSIYNPGSALQAYGLQKYLLQNGYDTEIIDYRPYYSTIGKNKIKGIARKILYFRNEIIIKKKYEDFMSKNMILTKKRYTSYRELEQKCPSADVYIAGSDQLWNMSYDCGRDNSYYLEFVKTGRRISYATSVGKKHIPQDEILAISKRIEGFHSISVREKSTSEVFSKLLDRDIKWVCDPVFLLPVSEYEKMTRRLIEAPYAVVYLSAESELLNSVVRDIKSTLGCKIVLMGGNRTRCECDIHLKDIGPEDFLSLIKYAEIVISSSFHATAFSHIFHKKFGVILPNGNGERIESLLELSGLSNHIIKNKEDITNIYSDIDFASIDDHIDSFVNESKDYLVSALNR